MHVLPRSLGKVGLDLAIDSVCEALWSLAVALLLVEFALPFETPILFSRIENLFVGSPSYLVDSLETPKAFSMNLES